MQTQAVSRIRIGAPRQEAGRVYWEGELILPTGVTQRIFFDFSTPDERPYLPRARPFLLAFLLPAMQAGAPLELELPVDAVTLDNLMEFQEAMASWEPKKLKVVPIRAPVDTAPEISREPGALTAFSGGVDSCFTVWRHTQKIAEPLFRKIPLRAGLMIHGFDIPLAQEDVFERAWNRSRKMLAEFGLKAYRLKTNLRTMDKLPGCEWSCHSHGIWLAAALSCYEPWFGQILIPSTFVYPMLQLPWGSNPITDALFASATTPLWHDGAAFSKLVKTQVIAAAPTVQRHLRVCWEGQQLDRNCGKCFKCIATQVCFQLAGVEQPEAFDVRCTIAEIACLPVTREQNEWLLRSMSDEARRQGKNEIVAALDHALTRAARKRRALQIKKQSVNGCGNRKVKSRAFRLA